MHLYPVLAFVVPRFVFETRQIEIAAKFTVYPREQVEIEGGRHACGIGVGLNHSAVFFLQIRTQVKDISGNEKLANIEKKFFGTVGFEIAKRAPEKKHEQCGSCGTQADGLLQPAEIRIGDRNDVDRIDLA